MSDAAARRARTLGADVERRVIPLAFHAVALRLRDGGTLALPGAARYGDFVAAEVERFCA